MGDNKRKSQPEKTDYDQYYDTFNDGSEDQQKEKRRTEEDSAMTNTKNEISASKEKVDRFTGRKVKSSSQYPEAGQAASNEVDNVQNKVSSSSSTCDKTTETKNEDESATERRHNPLRTDTVEVMDNQPIQEEQKTQSVSSSAILHASDRNSRLSFGNENHEGKRLRDHSSNRCNFGRDSRANIAAHGTDVPDLRNTTHEIDGETERRQRQRQRKTKNIANMDNQPIQEEHKYNSLQPKSQLVTSSSRIQSSEQNIGISFGRVNQEGSNEDGNNYGTGGRTNIATRQNAGQDVIRGGDGGDGGDGEDVFRRLFGRSILRFNVRARTHFDININATGLTLTPIDIERFIKFFSIAGFRFITISSSTFVFIDDNRSEAEVVSVLNNIKYRIKSLCFARFCGEGIINPNDLVVSFGLSNGYGYSRPFMVI